VTGSEYWPKVTIKTLLNRTETAFQLLTPAWDQFRVLETRDEMEQRKAQRFELKLPLELIRKGSQALSEHGETRNLSSVGVLFEAGATLRIGEAVEYMITLPSTAARGDNRVRLHCLGKVVRFSTETGVAATLERYEFVR
jgi:hypothetical protein